MSVPCRLTDARMYRCYCTYVSNVVRADCRCGWTSVNAERANATDQTSWQRGLARGISVVVVVVVVVVVRWTLAVP